MKGGCQSGRKVLPHDSKSDLPLFPIYFQLVDVSEWSKSDNESNVRLIFNQHWRPGVTVSSLLIQRVNKSHNGIFQCSPSNSEAKTIKVHVLEGKMYD